MNNIEAESEDLFANAESTKRDAKERKEEAEVDDDSRSELSAAAALTSLVCCVRENYADAEKDGDDEDEREEDDEEVKKNELDIPQRYTRSGRKRAVSFPLKLLKVLSTQKHADVISWTPSGKAFEIRKPKQFVADLLPNHFKSAKYSSFTRKLHRWGFMRHYRGDEAGAFYHELFVRDRLDLVEQMTCHKPPEAPSVVAAVSAQRRASEVSKPSAPPPVAQQSPADPSPVTCVRPVVTVNATRAIRSSSLPMVQPVPAVDQQAVDLNAAIEMEVSRRLTERINSAAISRQVLALMEKQKQQAKLNTFLGQRIIVLAQQQSRLQASGLSLPQTVDLAQLYIKFKPAPTPNITFGTADSFIRSLPHTNIQGAKTA